jgi:1,4-dihydroxy-2-naphthoate octaprenyltransferase
MATHDHHQPNETPNSLQTWLLAARPKTLPAAAAPVIVASAVALHESVFRVAPALAALGAALLIQIGTNLANDVFDFKRGADSSGRLGPLRVTQAGLLKPHQVMIGMGLTFCLAALLGVYLILEGGWPILVLGILSIASGIAYTGGPFPLGYNGLGDLFVFLFFGFGAVCGTYYVQAGTLSAAAVWTAIPMGALTTNILVVNNLRDIESDRAVGKRTLVVRLGVGGARIEYLVMLSLAYLAPFLMWLFSGVTPWVLTACLSLPWVYAPLKAVMQEKGRILNKTLAETARHELVYSLTFSLGLIIARVF